MDKIRRKKASNNHRVSDQKYIDSLYAIAELVSSHEQCGMFSKKYNVSKEYGQGFFWVHRFEGVSILILDMLLTDNLVIEGALHTEVLEMSFLIEGEQIVAIDGISKDIVYEDQESYLLFLNDIKGKIQYRKRKQLKEIKIRMDMSFIQRHKIDKEYAILEQHSLIDTQKNFLHPLCATTQDILSEVLTDKRTGLLKRLFLESKVLALMGLKLEMNADTHTSTTAADHLIKKLYQVQHMIASELSTQYSIHQIARKVGVNDFVLKKEFKVLFGQTIFEYATELRMDKAKKLLLHSKKPVYEISESVGYKNATHFTAAFKKIEGITPRQFRVQKVQL